MALETLKDVTQIGGFDVVVVDELREKDIGSKNFIAVRKDKNSISFTIQNGPIKEHGVNGCQVDTIIEAAKVIVEGLNKQFPCRENAVVITKLDEALLWSMKRKLDREKRGVEGLSKA